MTSFFFFLPFLELLLGNNFDWQGKSSPLWGPVPEEISFPVLTELLKMSEEEFLNRFASTAVKRIGRERLLRNVAVALGNLGDADAIPALERCVRVEDSDLVKEHASWAIRQLLGKEKKKEKKENIEAAKSI